MDKALTLKGKAIYLTIVKHIIFVFSSLRLTQLMHAPLVSIVMAVHNGEPFIHEAMSSIFSQTFEDFELIVVDDASTDGTLDILKSYSDGRMKILTNSSNIGQTRSLNRGLKIARGELIARHDADDISFPDRIRLQVEAMTDQPDLGLLGSGYEIIDRTGKTLEVSIPPSSNVELKMRLKLGNCLCHGSTMFKATCLSRVGAYCEYFRVTQDYDLWLRISEQYAIASLPMLLYRFRFNTMSVSRQKRPLQLAYQDLALELAKQRNSGGSASRLPDDVLVSFPPDPEKLMHDARGTAYLYYAAGELTEATHSLEKAQTLLTEEMNLPAASIAEMWQSWTFGRALALSDLRGDSKQGIQFIQWVFNTLHPANHRRICHIVMGELYANQAFAAFQRGHNRQALFCFWQSIRCDRRWIFNRGLWSLALKGSLSLR